MVTRTITSDDKGLTAVDAKAAGKVMFVNWSVDQQTYNHTDLLAGDDFSDYNILFLDPLAFAEAHGLRNNSSDLSETEYFPYDEREFGQYLVGIKQASTGLLGLLNRGGVLVLRSQIPNSHIKVRKRTTAGGGTYTQSLLSAFFWLEEILGKYSFKSCHLRAVRYLAPNDPVSKLFGRGAVDCIQTQNVMDKGRREIIAVGGPYFKDPIVSRLTSVDWPGLVYVVPRFSSEGEAAHLVSAFTEVHKRHRLNPDRPKWISQYETQLNDLSPFRAGIDLAETQIETLKRQLAGLQHKHEDLRQLANMLHRERDQMASAIEIALSKLGFTTHVLSCEHDSSVWVAVETENDGHRVVFAAATSDQGPITSSDVDNFKQVVDQQNSRAATKGVLIGNADRGRPPEERTDWFEPECMDLARQADICLIPSAEFFAIVTYLMNKADADNLDDLKASIRREIIACDSQLELNRQKYRL
ncbi:MAG: hypothetical protein OEV49_11855 [candidate division Zixibacteria bacterium]|nr:hypothetical protein [candidate division Zixibacteria bacterium]MDH3936023.1 hypothetical protein [candidate division Zixibacteria bacterium]MDH4033173.1 hypothetical protein [candidate division Zixibacteria bacterium]